MLMDHTSLNASKYMKVSYQNESINSIMKSKDEDAITHYRRIIY